MSQALLAHVILPITLAIMMLGMGLSLRWRDFTHLIRKPQAVLVGVALQLIGLPLLAWSVISIWQLPPMLAAGLVILAAAPGGATSNIISYLSKGDVALSVSLTAIVSLCVPFSIPVLVNLQFAWLGLDTAQFYLPLLPTIMQLLLVTVVPILLGMSLNHYFHKTCQRLLPYFQQLILVVFILLVIALAWVNWARLPAVFSQVSAASLSLCVLAMLLGAVVAKVLSLSAAAQRTYAIELGIQNAGTAMMVAVSLLGKPELAIVPLFYGIAMNIPAFTLVFFMRRQTAHA